MSRLIFLLSTMIAIGLAGCSSRGSGPQDGATYGSIKIAVDESLKPLIDAEVKAFEGVYTNAHVTALYVSEAEAIQLIQNDSVRLAILTRNLTAEEWKPVTELKIKPMMQPAALEGIALIVNRESIDTLWDMTRVKNVLAGTNGAKEQVVFDHQSSGIVRVMRDSVLAGSQLSATAYAAGTNEGVVDYVSKNKNAIGLIGVSWISDRDDSTANRFLNTIRVIGIRHDDEYYKPYQAYIAQKFYSLIRTVVINGREGRTGLGTGFARYITGPVGQRVVLKAGLVPVTMPIRIVEISREPL